MILGLFVGAAAMDFPVHLISGLNEREALKSEIESFAEVVAIGEAF